MADLARLNRKSGLVFLLGAQLDLTPWVPSKEILNGNKDSLPV